jgi:hypothetical protein
MSNFTWHRQYHIGVKFISNDVFRKLTVIFTFVTQINTPIMQFFEREKRNKVWHDGYIINTLKRKRQYIFIYCYQSYQALHQNANQTVGSDKSCTVACLWCLDLPGNSISRNTLCVCKCFF